MDNGAKALIIAGGVMIAVLTMSLFIRMFDNVSQFAGDVEDNSTQQEIIDFNQPFMSYNKKLMYGADVLSVINKAIDNNKSYGVENETNSPYYIDIGIKLADDLEYRKVFYKRVGGEGTFEYTENRTEKTTTPLKKNVVYSLSNNSNKDIIIKMLVNYENYTYREGGRNITVINGKDTLATGQNSFLAEYYVEYFPHSEFKRRYFKCESVEYNTSGRIKKMLFTEIK